MAKRVIVMMLALGMVAAAPAASAESPTDSEATMNQLVEDLKRALGTPDACATHEFGIFTLDDLVLGGKISTKRLSNSIFQIPISHGILESYINGKPLDKIIEAVETGPDQISGVLLILEFSTTGSASC